MNIKYFKWYIYSSFQFYYSASHLMRIIYIISSSFENIFSSSSSSDECILAFALRNKINNNNDRERSLKRISFSYFEYKQNDNKKTVHYFFFFFFLVFFITK